MNSNSKSTTRFTNRATTSTILAMEKRIIKKTEDLLLKPLTATIRYREVLPNPLPNFNDYFTGIR